MLVLSRRWERRRKVARILVKIGLLCERHLLGRQRCGKRGDAGYIEQAGSARHYLLWEPAHLFDVLVVSVYLLGLNLVEWLLKLNEVLGDKRRHRAGHDDRILRTPLENI